MRPSPSIRALLALLLLTSAGACAAPDDERGDEPGGARGDGVAVVAPGDDVPSAMDAISAQDIENHLRALSHDSMAGRAPGTPGGRMAAEYIASAFEAAGLQPVEGSWFQPVPIVGSTPIPASAELTAGSAGDEVRLAYLDDFVAWSGDAGAEEARAEGEVVFVGYGIEAPEAEWSDFDGMDLTGKVLLILVNDPPAPADEPELFGGPAMTYYGRWTYKFEEAARRGAAAALLVHTTESAGYGWNVVQGSWTGEQLALPADPDAPSPASIEAWVTKEAAARMLEEGGHDLDELMERAESRDFTPVATGLTLQASLDSEVRRAETRNVVGILPGSGRPDEVITVTSHYDHLGVGGAVDGDSIYNGAYDNASGTALLIELADAFATLDPAPARSILFIATAAEEQGLLGAAWYVQDPLLPLSRTVAEVNVDGGNLWGETDDLTVMGAERNELGPVAEARAGQLGMSLAPDAEPEKGFFFRSDHFPFAKAGVPALYFEHGRQYRGRPAGWGDSIQADYQATRYHAPADEFNEDFDYSGAIQQAKAVFLTVLDIARSDAWPNWSPDSEFRAARDRTMEEGRPGS